MKKRHFFKTLVAIRSLLRLRRARFREPQQHVIVTQPEMEVSACEKKCWRHLVFAQRLSFFIASYLTDEHLEPTKSIQDNRSKKYPESPIFFFFSYLVSLRVDLDLSEH